MSTGEFRPEITVVVPVHNEEANLLEFHERLSSAMRNYGHSHELIFVDDGSSDGSLSLLRRIVAQDPLVTALRFSRNYGQWVAIYAGLRNSRGRYVVVMDSDLQHVPEEIPLLLDKAREGYDLVSGWRQGRSETFILRRLPSLIANWMIRFVSKCPMHDMGGFKCLRGEWARTLHMSPGAHRFLPALVYILGGTVTEVPISAPPRKRGRSHYGLGRLPDVILDIISLWFQAAYLGRPLHLLGKLAAVLIAGGGILFVCMLYDKFILGLPMGTRPLLTIAVLSVLLGVQCLILGLLADVISRIYYTVRDRRPYHIKERICQNSSETDEDGLEPTCDGAAFPR
jgi:hypothetical protein